MRTCSSYRAGKYRVGTAAAEVRARLQLADNCDQRARENFSCVQLFSRTESSWDAIRMQGRKSRQRAVRCCSMSNRTWSNRERFVSVADHAQPVEMVPRIGARNEFRSMSTAAVPMSRNFKSLLTESINADTVNRSTS